MINVSVQVASLDNSSDVVNPPTAVLTRMRNSSPDRHFLTNTILQKMKSRQHYLPVPTLMRKC